MASTLQTVLGYESLLGIIKTQADGIPNVLPPEFMNTTRTVVGKSGRYVRVVGTRNVLPRVEYGAPALRVPQKSISDIPVILNHFFAEITFDPTVLIQLRQFESYENQRMGEDEIARQTESMTFRLMNTRIASVTQALATGYNYFDGSGNLLPSSSGATVTVDYAIAANNRNQLNGIITQSWADSSANIPAQFRALLQRSLQLTGYPVEYAFYGANIPTYININDYTRDWIIRNPQLNSEYMGSRYGELGNLFGIRWIPAYTAFYEDSGGTNRSIIGDDTIVFTPAPSRMWWEMLEGTYPVPTSIDIAAEGLGAANNVKIVAGQGGYGRVIDNPVTIVCRYFDTFLPVIKVPDAVFIADVTP